MDFVQSMYLEAKYRNMAINRLTAGIPALTAQLNSSTTWMSPPNANRAYVVVQGAQGGSDGYQYNGGGAITAAGMVNVAPSSNYVVTVGAAGNNGAPYLVYTRYSSYIGGSNTGGTGGTTVFDGSSVIAYGGTGGFYTGYGSTGSVAFDTNLPVSYPTGAVARTTDTATNNTVNYGSGKVWIYTWPNKN
jgi:hypothetical protein